MIKNVPKFGQNIDNLLLCKQRIQETGKLYVHSDTVLHAAEASNHAMLQHHLFCICVVGDEQEEIKDVLFLYLFDISLS